LVLLLLYALLQCWQLFLISSADNASCCCCCCVLCAGGGCGVGVGLGWGYGAAWGSKYIIVEPEFSDDSKAKKPKWFAQLQQQWRIATFEHAHKTSQ
jgi:hypothetical protein